MNQTSENELPISKPMPASTYRTQRGQTILVALLVLLLLAFIGGIFIAVVSRNLQHAERQTSLLGADYYAEAGIRFADEQLTYSPQGADWRPPLQFQYGANQQIQKGTYQTISYLPTDPAAVNRYNAYATATNLPACPPQDPDYQYLIQGFTRFNIGGGRFLLRVTYDPAQVNPNQDGTTLVGTDVRRRYIKIESIGRFGAIDSTDPTTYQNGEHNRAATTLVAYKAIGITDYGRFETNPDNRSGYMALGVASMLYTDENETIDKGRLITPGCWDFSPPYSAGATTPGAIPTSVVPFPIVTTYGASDAYITNGSTVTPNPDAGTGSTSAPTGYSGNVTAGGGSLHANGSVRIFGINDIYLDSAGAQDFPSPPPSPTPATLGESWEVAGNIVYDNYVPQTSSSSTLAAGQSAALNLESPGMPTLPRYLPVFPSNDPNLPFNTYSGAIRDGNSGNDAAGYPRSANRLDPPVMNSVNPANNIPRYRDITANSAPRIDPTQPLNGSTTPASPVDFAANSAAFGYGQSVYVNNFNDSQPDSTQITGGHTLVDEWLNGNKYAQAATTKHGWTGPFYNPPGVEIVLGRQVEERYDQTASGLQEQSAYGIRLVRSDTDAKGNPIYWNNPDGSPGASQTMVIAYKDLNASNNPYTTKAPTNPVDIAAYQSNPNNDVVIYAEGNVRVRGAVSAASGDTANPTDLDTATASGPANETNWPGDDHLPRHITIVTNGTAYIDGDLVRGNPDSSITVLAHDYVCVNTTQFLAGAIADHNLAGSQMPGAFTGDPSISALDLGAPNQVLLQEFDGVLQPKYLNSSTAPAVPSLYVSGGPASTGATTADFDIIDPTTGLSTGTSNPDPFGSTALFTTLATDALETGSSPPAPLTAGFSYLYPSTGSGVTSLTRNTFPLSFGLQTSAAGADTAIDSIFYDLAVRRDIGTDQSNLSSQMGLQGASTADFLLERAAILPMNVRIEAVMFAQTRSFFVIPGDWFNTNSDDTLSNFIASGIRPDLDVTEEDQSRFPFYGQPIDMQIIIDGAISEARPADISAQTAWMLKWGWIPQYHGSLIAGGALPAEQVVDSDVSPPTGYRTAQPDATNPAPALGLTIIYNPLAGYPYDHYPSAAAGPEYLRMDLAGRPLPYSPDLPACTGLTYSGTPTEEGSLLQ